jgi:hypothetical protein
MQRVASVALGLTLAGVFLLLVGTRRETAAV